MSTISEQIEQAVVQLAQCSESARLDAQLLMAYTLHKDQTYLHTWPDRTLTEAEQENFEQLVGRRLQGEPIAHILGQRAFWTLDLKVTPATLIPRPDTELLVELALQRIPPQVSFQIADLGTGSGAIALALAKERPACQLLATDQSVAALQVAQENAEHNHVHNIEFVQSDWFSALGECRFDMIVSNPPYICDNDPHLQQGDVRFEPRSALTAGADGLKDIRIIVDQALQFLKPSGLLLIEHGFDQAATVCALLQQAGYQQVADFQDYAGNPRVAIGQKSSSC